MRGLDAADATLLRSLHRTLRALRPPRPQLWDGIYAGVIRRTQRSQALATLQSQAGSLNLTSAFRAGGAAAITIPALGVLSRDTLPRRESRAGAVDTAYAALRQLHLLEAALTALECQRAFIPMRRTPEVQYFIGQRLDHRFHGPCVVYGWDRECHADDPPTAAALDLAGGPAGIVDNRKTFVGIDSGVDKRQPFYRVQLRDGRGHYCAQELLQPVPLSEAFRIPIQGTSFFFVRANPDSGCLVPRAELATRYPDDFQAAIAHSSHETHPSAPPWKSET